MEQPISGILLAGGRSKRMGVNKAFLKFKGKELYTYPLDVLRRFCDDIVISAPARTFPPDFPYPVVPDIFPGKGPLAGIHSGLRKVRHDRTLVLSCDIPFISAEFIGDLQNKMGDAPAIAGIGTDGRPESLAAIYLTSLQPLMEEQLNAGKLRMTDFLMLIHAKLISTIELGYDPGRLFFNINTKEDLLRIV